MFEHKAQPLLPRHVFVRRQFSCAVLAAVLIALALCVGAVGYHYFEYLSWLNSFYAASMILTGMGPVGDVKSDGGKLFASFYAIFSGVVFLSAASVLIAPSVHRMLHRLHLEEENAG